MRLPALQRDWNSLARRSVNQGDEIWREDRMGNAKMFLAMERNGNSLGFASSERLEFIEKNELPFTTAGRSICLLLGCLGSYDLDIAQFAAASIESAAGRG
jgi:hypothetical protein